MRKTPPTLIVIFLTVILVAMAVRMAERRTESETDRAPSLAVKKSQRAPKAEKPRTGTVTVTADGRTAGGSEESRELELPTLSQVQDEVLENPEQTVPRSVLTFAAQMATRMDEALVSQAKAAKLIDELAKCVSEDEVAPTVRVMCLENARTLGLQWPGEIETKFLGIRKSAPARISALANAIVRLGEAQGG